MVTLNDYLYSGDTVLRILQKYMQDLRKEAKEEPNEQHVCKTETG